MTVYYYVKVPKLPPDVAHQNGNVQLVEYVLSEGDVVKPGHSIAIVENWWARMAFRSIGPGYVSKTFFDPGTYVREGDPLAIILCDPENAPPQGAGCELEVLTRIREKPNGQRA